MVRWLAPLLLTGCLVPQSMVDHLLDQDDDGERPVVVGGTDCDDHDLHVGAFAPEVCGNGVDEDCNGLADDVGVGAITVFLDGDGDGYGDSLAPLQSCTIRPGTVAVAGDCDDNNRFDHPNAPEDCTDGRDNDCDRVTDEADSPPQWFIDQDGDGFGNAHSIPIESCVPVEGRVPESTDCNDASALSRPGAAEIPYDGLDNACDGGDDFDLDGDGFGVDPTFATFVIPPGAYVYNPNGPMDCDDLNASINPDARDFAYDGVDANCDGEDDFDADQDGFSSAEYGGADCDDDAYLVNPSRVEVPYDGVDDDCDPTNDDDVDADGHAAATRGGDDCDDSDELVWSMCVTCGDGDLDGRRWGCDAYDATGEDCNDLNANVWSSCATCGDADGDGRFDGCDAYNRISKDCDDTNPYAWVSCATCTDVDGDGHYGKCDRSTGASQDCDDVLANAWLTCATCTDVDGDGYGTGSCDGPPDCDDSDPNSATACGACLDLDDDGSYSGCDRYDTVVEDCDDDDPSRGGATAEILEDGIDQDCDGEDLTVDEAHGVFITPSGVDDEWCGTRAWPCATLEHGAVQVRARGNGVLFLGSGAYNASWVYSGMYGGFDSSWTRGVAAGPSVIIVDASHQLMVVADRIAIDGLTVRSGSNWAGGRLMRVDAEVASVVDGDFIGSSLLGGCDGAQLNASISKVDRTRLEMTCRDSVVGIEISPIDTRHVVATAKLRDVVIGATSTTSGGVRAAVVRASIVFVADTTLKGQSTTECTSISVAGTVNALSSANVINSSLECDTGSSGSSAYGWFGTNFSNTKLYKTSIRSKGSSSSFGVWTYASENSQVEIYSTGISAESDGESYAVTLGLGPTEPRGYGMTLLHSTLVATSPGFAMGVEVSSGAEMTVVNTAIQSSDVALHTAGAIDLHGVYLDAPCALGDRSICDAATTEQVSSCRWFGCQAAEACTVGDAGLGGAGVDPWVPSANSPLIDAGVDVSGWSTDADLDLYGTPRPLGGANDIGAVELR